MWFLALIQNRSGCYFVILFLSNVANYNGLTLVGAWLMFIFDLLLFSKVTGSHLWLLNICMLSLPHRILLLVVSILSLYSVHLLLKTANEGGKANCSFTNIWYFFHVVSLWNAPFHWILLFYFRIFIVWTIRNEGIWYGWKTCCFWINYNAEHWRWGDLKMSVLSVVIVPYLFLETFFSHNMCS